jgi:hypothetical protein
MHPFKKMIFGLSLSQTVVAAWSANWLPEVCRIFNSGNDLYV